MYQITVDLQAELTKLLADVPPERIVVVEEHPEFPGALVFQVFENERGFYSRYRDWVSCYMMLSELANLTSFIDKLYRDGWEVVFGPGCDFLLSNMTRWSVPLRVEGYDLHPFQQFALRRAFELDYFFWNWATGAGKSFISAVGAKELFARDEIDVVIACTVSKSKENLRRFFEKAGLDAVVNDGTRPKRLKGYAESHQVYVCNYEKLWVDYNEIAELTRGRRVLFVFDECHKIITADTPNKARTAFHRLHYAAAEGTKVWPMSASVVNGNPLRYRDVYNLRDLRTNPLGTQAQFEHRYANSVKTVPLETRSGRTFNLTVYDWNETRLQEVRHRVGHLTQAVRKTDPGVRELFRGLQTIVVPIQASREERKLADFIIDRAREAYQRGETLVPYYHLLRATADHPLALLHTDSEQVTELFDHEHWVFDKLMTSAPNTKLDVLNEQLEEIREAQDKVLVFTRWTNLSLHLIEPHITVPHVTHFGVGQTNAESQAAQDKFISDPDITCFLTSDAGMHGLNMQCARYVIQYDPTYSYDEGMQRASRIDRSDSHLDGLTNFVFVTEDSIEERVWNIQNARRAISAAVQGTEEGFSYGDVDRERALRSEAQNMAFMIFGNRQP